MADTIQTLIAESAGANFFSDCETAVNVPWLPDEPPLVHFAAEDQVFRLETRGEIVAYCERIAQGRVSTHEEVEDQTVHLLSPDVAYVVTRSTQTTLWQGGRTDVRPTVETAIVERQGDRWRVLYKHLSWAESAPERQ